MALIPPMYAELRANISEFSAKMKEAQGEAEETAEKSGGSFAKLSSVGKGALLGVAGVAVAVGGESIHLAENFQSSTASIASNAGISVAAAKRIGDAFLSTGFHSTFSAQEMDTAYAAVAGQLGQVQGKALNSAQALTFMKSATDLAEASGSDLTSTTATLTTAIQAFGMGTQSAGDVATYLFNASRLTGQGLDTTASSLEKLNSKLGAASPGVQDLSASLIDLVNNGVTGRSAISDLDTGLTSLVVPTKAGAKELQNLGVSVTDSRGNFVGMGKVIGELGPKLLSLSPPARDAAASAIFGTTAWKGMLLMLQSGTGEFDKASAAVSKSGSVESGAAAQAKTLHGELKTAEAGAQDLGVQLGTLLIPVVTKLIGVISDVVGWFAKHKSAAVALGVVVGGALLVAIGAYVVSMISAAAATIAAVAPILLIVGAVALVAFGIYELVTHWTTVWNFIKRLVSEAVDFVRRHLMILATTILLPLAPLILLLTHWRQVWGFIERVPGEVVDFIKGHLKLLGEILLGPIGALMALKDHWSSIWHSIKDGPGEAVSLVKHHAAMLAEAAMGPPGWAMLVKQHWRGIWDHLPGPVQHALTDVKPAVAALAGVFERLAGDVAKTGAKVVDAVGGFLEKLPDRMAYWSGFAVGKFVGILMALPGDVLRVGESVVTNLARWGADLAVGAARIGTTVVGAIVGFFLSLPGKILGALEAVAGALASFIPQAVSWATNIGTHVVTGVVSFFLSLPGKVLSALGSLISTLAGFVPQVVTAAGHIGKGILDGIINFVKQIPGEILSVITNIPQMLEHAVGSIASGALHIGKSLLGGFLDGIGKHSPSALERAVDEVIVGLRGKMTPLSGIVGQINGMAPRPAALSPGGVAPAGAVGGGAGALNISVTVQGHILSPDGLAQSLVQPLRSMFTGTLGRGVAGPLLPSGNR